MQKNSPKRSLDIILSSPLSNVEVMDFLTETLGSVDCEVERVEYRDPAGVLKVNLIGRKGPVNGNPGLALLGHIDTVPAIGWSMDPFEARIVDGKMYGRGSCDMKGSVACMIEVASHYDSAKLAAPLYVVITADEEVGYLGQQRLPKSQRCSKNTAFHNTVSSVNRQNSMQYMHTKGLSALLPRHTGVQPQQYR